RFTCNDKGMFLCSFQTASLDREKFSLIPDEV
ncbi:unnamed protein product, partial [marine sediment metagenome]